MVHLLLEAGLRIVPSPNASDEVHVAEDTNTTVSESEQPNLIGPSLIMLCFHIFVVLKEKWWRWEKQYLRVRGMERRMK